MFALERLADLEKTNQTRIRYKREEALNEIIVPKLELIQLFESFKKLQKNCAYLNGKEVALSQRHRKHSLRNYLTQWYRLKDEIHSERENMEVAKNHHTRRVRVTVKLLIYKWRKLLKDSAKEMVEKLTRFDLRRAQWIVDTWKLMVIKRYCCKMREKYFKRKVLQSFRLAQNEKAEMNQYKKERMRKVTFVKWRQISR